MSGKRLILGLKTLVIVALASLFLSVFFKNVESMVGEPVVINPVFQKGMSYVSWPPRFDSAESDESLRLLSLTNTEWVAICLFWYQDTVDSEDIRPLYNSPSDESLIHVINKAHELGMKVMLKPMVDPLDGHWRGEIPSSAEWFESYASFINRWAGFSETHGVDILCIGCEFNANDWDEENWRKIVAGVRERYSGPITYAANHDNYQNVKWWDSLDYVGIDAYFPLTNKDNPTLEELTQAWERHAEAIEAWVSTLGKPVVFTEIGYRSGDGTNRRPWEWSAGMGVDLKEQADCYEAAFQALWNKSWFYGFYWWNWETKPSGDGVSNGYTPQKKPAEDVVRKWYSRKPHASVFLTQSREAFLIFEEVSISITAIPNYPRAFTVHYVVVTNSGIVKSGEVEVQVPSKGVYELQIGRYWVGEYMVNVTVTDAETHRILCEDSVKITVELPVAMMAAVVAVIVTLLIVLATIKRLRHGKVRTSG
ncbi:MAG: hypothetical protein QW304_03090 [Thermoproteota archaeon]